MPVSSGADLRALSGGAQALRPRGERHPGCANRLNQSQYVPGLPSDAAALMSRIPDRSAPHSADRVNVSRSRPWRSRMLMRTSLGADPVSKINQRRGIWRLHTREFAVGRRSPKAPCGLHVLAAPDTEPIVAAVIDRTPDRRVICVSQEVHGGHVVGLQVGQGGSSGSWCPRPVQWSMMAGTPSPPQPGVPTPPS